MASKIISKTSVPGFEVESCLMKGEILHRVKVVGPVSMAQRIPLYQLTLETNRSHGKAIYFSILDNSENHENELTYGDLKRLDQMIKASGVTDFYCATITADSAYESVVALAMVNHKAVELGGDLLATRNSADAEAFILDKIAAHAS